MVKLMDRSEGGSTYYKDGDADGFGDLTALPPVRNQMNTF